MIIFFSTMENELEETLVPQARESLSVVSNRICELNSNVKTAEFTAKESLDNNGSAKPIENDLEREPSTELITEASVSLEKKVKEIEAVLSEIPVNKSKLIELAKSEGGFVSDKLRERAWPIVLDIDIQLATPPPCQEELEAHEEYKQVVMDVNRSLKRFPPDIPHEQIVTLQEQLTRLIMRVIIKHPHLRYYQGYHDVAVTFLLVVGESVAFQIMEKLSTGHFKDYMEPTMDETSFLLNFVYPLIRRMNPALHDYMEKAEVGTIFCLEWPLTWYGHSLKQYRDIVRLYDYFLVSPPLLPLYLAAAMVVHRQDDIFAQECDMASIHSVLSKIPDSIPFESLLREASDMYEKYPPASIEKEVKERFEEELRKRRYVSPRQAQVPARYQQWRWRPLNRFIPPWIAAPMLAVRPRMPLRYPLILVTATMVGLYAWMRVAEAVAVDSSFDVR